MNTKNVGVIGLGAMGLGIARSLLRSGFNVHACDVRTSVTEAFAQEGGVACESPAAMAAACDVIVTVVVNAEQTETVLFGENGAIAALRPGSLVIGCATVAPTFAVELGERLAAQNLLYLDAPISGGAAKAASGQMTMMTSGPAESYAKAEAILNGMQARSIAWATSTAWARKSKSSTSCWPVCTSPRAPKPWRWACVKVSMPTRCTK